VPNRQNASASEGNVRESKENARKGGMGANMDTGRQAPRVLTWI